LHTQLTGEAINLKCRPTYTWAAALEWNQPEFRSKSRECEAPDANGLSRSTNLEAQYINTT